MHLNLLLCAIFCFSTITFVECKSYVFTGCGWKNVISARSGEDSRSHVFQIGTLNSVGLKYEDISAHTLVEVFGDLKGHTGVVGNDVPNPFPLNTFEQVGNYKKFYAEWWYKTKSGLSSQHVKILLTVKFLNNGKVELDNYVYAGSWWTDTCAETTSYVNRIEIIN